MPIIAGAIAAGTSLIAGGQARKSEQQARKLSEQEKANALKLLERAGSTDAFFQALQESQLKSGHQKALTGFSGARKATELGADAARRTVLDQGQRMQADATQGLISKGLIGTTAGTGAATDLAGQTTMQLAAIDQQLAEAFANLNLQQGEVEQGQSQELAGLIGSGRQFQQQLGTLRAEYAPSGYKSPKKKHGIGGFLQNYTPAGIAGGMLGLY